MRNKLHRKFDVCGKSKSTSFETSIWPNIPFLFGLRSTIAYSIVVVFPVNRTGSLNAKSVSLPEGPIIPKAIV